MISTIKRLLGWKYVGRIDYTVIWSDRNNEQSYMTYLLYEHPWFGRDYKAVGFRYSHMKKENKVFTRLVAPWLSGAELPEGMIT